MTGIRLVCKDCGAGFTASRLTTGKAPACRKCGGALQAPGRLVLGCAECQVRSKPARVDLGRAKACPKCQKPLRVLGQQPEEPPTPAAADPTPPVSQAPRSVGATTAPPDGVNADAATIMMDASQMALPTDPAEERPVEGETVAPRSATDDTDELAVQPEEDAPPGGLRGGSFGKYKVLGEIARGGMGIVYRVRDPALRRVVALKVLIAGEGVTEESLQRFLREARAAGSLRHPHIVPVHEVGQIDGQYYFTMDYVEGRSFEDLIREKALEPAEIVGHLRDICLALHEAHNHGIIHRDLKPANIMLDERTGHAVLMDFGLAKDTGSNSIQSVTGSIFGTPAYMSPEQAQGLTHEIDCRTDIYSLGVILYECLTGRQPFLGATIYDTISKVVADEPVPPHRIRPNAVPEELEAIILTCMEKDPGGRYQQILDLADDLRAYLNGAPVRAQRVSLPVRTIRYVRRRPVRCLAVAAALVVVLLGGKLLLAPGAVEVAQRALQSDDAIRQAGALRELLAQIEDEVLVDAEAIDRARGLFRAHVGASDPDVAAQAIRAVERLHDASALAGLLRVATDIERDPQLQGRAWDALESIAAAHEGKEPDMAATLAELVGDQQAPPRQRRRAIGVLQRLWGPPALPALVTVAEDEHEASTLRVAAVQALGEWMTMESPAMPVLLALFGDSQPAVAQAARNALAQARTRASIFKFYGVGAGQAMAAVGEVEALNAMRNAQLEALLDDPGGRPEKPRKPVEVLVDKLRDKAVETRLAAAYDLGVLGEAEAVGPLLSAVADDDGAVARVAARSLVDLASVRAPGAAELRPLLEHARPHTRRVAVSLAGELAQPALLPLLTERAVAEEDPSVLAAVATAMGYYDDAAAVQALEPLAVEKRTLVREAARRSLTSLTGREWE